METIKRLLIILYNRVLVAPETSSFSHTQRGFDQLPHTSGSRPQHNSVCISRFLDECNDQNFLSIVLLASDTTREVSPESEMMFVRIMATAPNLFGGEFNFTLPTLFFPAMCSLRRGNRRSKQMLKQWKASYRVDWSVGWTDQIS